MFGALFHSIVLSQTVGLYFMIMSIIMITRMQHYRDMISRMDHTNPAILVASRLALMIGCFLVVIHNLWVWEPRILLTLIGWFILIKSILWLGFPKYMLECAKKVYLSPWFYVYIIAIFIMGFFLLTKGFYLYIPPAHPDLTDLY